MEMKAWLEKIEWPKKLESCTITILIPQSGTILSFARWYIIATSGTTTWMQQIVAQLLFNGLEVEVAEMSPWLDLRVSPKDVKLAELEAQTQSLPQNASAGRCIGVFSASQVHLPWTGWTGCRVAYITSRECQSDVVWWADETPGLVPPIGKPPESIRQYFSCWRRRTDTPSGRFGRTSGLGGRFSTYQTFWCTMQKLKDLPGQMQRIAEFLAIPLMRWSGMLEHCSFDYMKQPTKSVLGGAVWGRRSTFIYRALTVDGAEVDRGKPYEQINN